MSEDTTIGPPIENEPEPKPHRRRVRYAGKNPRRFEDKYKELNPDRHPETISKVRASGKTPAGQHVPIMLTEILKVLAPRPGERAVDATLGYGGHARAILKALAPDGQFLGLDQDPIEIVKTETRLKKTCASTVELHTMKMNFAGLQKALGTLAWEGVDLVLADLGCSSMQFDNPARGFSFKHLGPLDMRMNPERGLSAREWLKRISPTKLEAALIDNADEPKATVFAQALAGQDMESTTALVENIQAICGTERCSEEDTEMTVRRIFQAIRIAVNEDFTALESFLRQLPHALRPGGRVAILTFHSGEDRRVKQAFKEGLRSGLYTTICEDVLRPSKEEIRSNPRASCAKLRWAVKGF